MASAATANRRAPLIAHVVDHFEAGGLENGLINLLNTLPPSHYAHVVVCLKGFSSFRDRIERDDVRFVALGKKPGLAPDWYGQLWRVLRELRPQIVHTRNLGTLEAQVVAAAARISARIHGEHGRDVWELYGNSVKYNALRRLLRPFVHRYVAVSKDLEGWLTGTVRVNPSRVTRIYNGVDTTRFHPLRPGGLPMTGGFTLNAGDYVIGTVGRLVTVKDQVTLTRAFLHLLATRPDLRNRLRLALVGDGPLGETCAQLLRAAGAADRAWLPGRRNDIPRVLQHLDLFVLPSIAEGTSNTILEAMASGLPVVATNVGGTPELVVDGVTGRLVPPQEPIAMADAIAAYVDRPELATCHGIAGRRRVDGEFSLAAMVNNYRALYDSFLGDAAASSRH